MINYEEKLFSDDLHDFDCALDCTGEVEHCVDVVKRGGHIVSIADTPGQNDLEGLQRHGVNISCCIGCFLNCLSHGVTKKARQQGVHYSYQFCVASGEKLQDVADFCDRGLIRPVVDSVYSFEHCMDAIDHIETGAYVGKIVVEIVKNIRIS